MNITELNGTELNGAGGIPVPDTLGFYGKTVRAATGAAIEGAEITVLDSAGEEAQLWSASLGNKPEPLQQPLTSDVTGAFSFYAAFGTYTVTISFLGESLTLNNQAIGPDLAFVNTKQQALPLGTVAYFKADDVPLGWVKAGDEGALEGLGAPLSPLDPDRNYKVMRESDVPGALASQQKQVRFAAGSLTMVVADRTVTTMGVLAAWKRYDFENGALVERAQVDLGTVDAPVYPGQIDTADLPDFEVVEANAQNSYAHGDGTVLAYFSDGTANDGARVRLARQNPSTGRYEPFLWASADVAAHGLNVNATELRYSSRNGIGFLVRWGGAVPEGDASGVLFNEDTGAVIASGVLPWTGFYGLSGGTAAVNEAGDGDYFFRNSQLKYGTLSQAGAVTQNTGPGLSDIQAISFDGSTLVGVATQYIGPNVNPAPHLELNVRQEDGSYLQTGGYVQIKNVKDQADANVYDVSINADNSLARVAYLTQDDFVVVDEYEIADAGLLYRGRWNPEAADLDQALFSGQAHLGNRSAPVDFYFDAEGDVRMLLYGRYQVQAQGTSALPYIGPIARTSGANFVPHIRVR